MLFDDLINMADQYVYTFEYQKPILNEICEKESDFKLDLQTSRGTLGESFFHNILDL